MDRLHALDAEFLHVEDDHAPMHIAGVCVFENPAPSRQEFANLLASRLHLLPRYRQRIRPVPLELGRPVWVDDEHFDLEYHLRYAALPEPGDQRVLETMMGRLMSHRLDRARPLWEAWLVEGLADNRWAIIFKVHHCMVDGVAGVALLSALLDVEESPASLDAEPWAPRGAPNGLTLVVGAWAGLAMDATRWLVQAPQLVVHPRRAVQQVVNLGSGLGGFLRHLSITTPLSIDGKIGARRNWATSSASMADIAKVREQFGGTINDVVMAAVTAGYRTLLLAAGEEPQGATLRCAIPVSVRSEDGKGVADNRVSVLLYELPVHIADPVERLRSVPDRISDLKGSHMADAGKSIAEVSDLLPPMLVGGFTRLFVRSEQLVAQRVINTIATNVPGPQFPLYCLGRKMLEYRPFVPITQGIRVGTAILSYDGRMFFGVTGDYDSDPDVGLLAATMAEEIGTLRKAAARQRRSSAKQRK